MCGFVGLIGLERAAPALALGLQAIQHRGQDAAGIGVSRGGHLSIHKDLGLVSAALPPEVLERMEGSAGLGHVRYPTGGRGSLDDAQPFMTRRPTMMLAHNGNLTNLPELERRLQGRGIRMMSRCDSEPILLLLGDELLKIRVAEPRTEDLVVALRQLMHTVRGSYSVVLVMELDGRESLVGFRDPHGIRPAVYGRRDDGAWMVASESVSLDVLGFQLVHDIPPGHLVVLRPGEEPVVRDVSAAPPKPCVFEGIYFARPDSRMEGHRVYMRRWALGLQLAEEWRSKGLKADVVVAVPDTSRPAAMAMAEALGLPSREGFIKNRYSGRTFIMPDQRTREAAHRLKLNPIAEIFRDRSVLLVDDSIVRGTTMRRIVQMVRGLGPAALHVAIFSPPVAHPCYYGIDMPSHDELVASHLGAREADDALSARFGADSLTFLSREGLLKVAGNDVCAACFTGQYPVPIDDAERGFIVDSRRGRAAGSA